MSYLETAGQRHAIPVGEMRIGSGPAAQIVVSEAGVLAEHAIVQGYPDGQVVVRRGQPEAEILINGVRLGPQPTPLLHGDKIQVGSTELQFADERRSGSTLYVPAMGRESLPAASEPDRSHQATGSTGGRIISLTDGREYVIMGVSMVFGRDAGCDVVLTDKNVSRRHAEIMTTPKGYVLVDSSTNGTFVNGARVEGQRVLARADVIRIGDDEFRFYADVASPASPVQGTEAPRSAEPEPAAAEIGPVPPAPIQRETFQPATSEAGGPTRMPETAGPASPPPPPPPAPTPATPQPTERAPGRLGAAPMGAAARLAHTQHGLPAIPRTPPPGQAARSEPPPAAPAPQPKAAPGPSGRPAVGPVLASLVVRSGSLKGHRAQVRVPIVNVGRAEYNDVVLPDDSVSASHAKLQRREGVWILIDLGSTNGTFVDTERVSGEMPLAPGAVIRFGDVQVMFEPRDDAAGMERGPATRMMHAQESGPPGPAAAPGTPATRQAAPPPQRAAIPDGPAAAPAPNLSSGARDAPRPAVRRPMSRPRAAAPASGGLPDWVIPILVLAVLVAVILFFLLR